MVSVMAMMPGLRERLSGHVNSAKTANNIPTKLDFLCRLKQDLPLDDPVLISEFLPGLFDLQSDRFSPARKFVTQIIGEIGLKHLDFLSEIVPVLIAVLQDDTPAVARQAIACGIDFFRFTLQMIAVQGLCSSELDSSLESSWKWILKLKDRIFSIAFQPGSGGTRLMALKCVETLILLYTPAPDGSLEPPPRQSFEGNFKEFNISWLRGGHPILNVRDMSAEATKSLGLLLDQLRFPTVKSLSNSMIIVLIKSLSTIAKQRPAFYGRILPVLLGLDLSNPVLKGMNVFGASRALKSAFLSCLKCTHPGAAPWRDRILGALKEMNAEALAEEALNDVHKTNGNLEANEMTNVKEEKPSNEVCDAVSGNLRRKRPEPQDGAHLAEDGDFGAKRIKAMPSTSDESTRDSNRNSAVSEHDVTANEASSSRDGDNGPVHQLVSMFGALVGQGEKAFGSLEILISSISADLLAEVVMANMQNFPPSCPKADGEDEVPLNMSMAGSDINNLSSYFSDAFPHSSACKEPTSLPDTKTIVSTYMEPEGQEESHLPAASDNAVISYSLNHEKENEMLPPGLATHYDVAPSELDKGLLSIPSDNPDTGDVESQIPGLDTPVSALSGSRIGTSLSPMDFEEASEEQVSAMARTPTLDSPIISAERSEELSPKAAVKDVNDVVSSTETSMRVSPHLVLPKMLAPAVDFDDEKKDELQKLAFVRIVEAYKQIAVAGGAQVRSSLLVFLGVEFPQELNPWKELQEHILSDYMNRDGHELTLRVLYRLFGEAEEESDFVSSTEASSAYETFLLTVAQLLKDSFPSSDKSLSRLLGEVPYLPPSILKLMESLCSPESCVVTEKETNTGDRVTQGLSTMWNLILLRPTIRDVCLKIVLQSAVHPSEKVRMKAIRLVANKLYPFPYTTNKIEDFAKEMLLSATKGDLSGRTDADVAVTEEQKVSDPEKTSNDRCSAADSHPSKSLSLLVSETQRFMSLYFALCTKKHSLFREIFVIYKNISNSVKQAVDQHIPILVRTMGSSPELLNILSDPPGGSENLLLQVLEILVSGTIPSPELIHTIRKLYDTKVKDIELLVPVLPFLPKDEVLKIFPHLVSLPSHKFHAALGRMLQGPSHSSTLLTPAEILIAIHGIDPDKDRIPLKKVTDACNACFEQQQYFTREVLAKVLNQLVEQIPLPLLFMRTVLQAIGTFPALVDFIMEILSRLVSKQIWKYPKLWVGFLKCAQLTKPQSFSVLLQLPPAQLENALTKIPALKAPLVAHAKQPDVHPSLPRSTLVVLEIVSDAQASSRAQSTPVRTQGTVAGARSSSQEQTNHTQNPDTPSLLDSQASSQAQSSQTQNQDKGKFSDSQASSQPQSSPTNNQDEGTLFDAQASSQAQSSPTQSQDTGNSDREMTEKSKESSSAG